MQRKDMTKRQKAKTQGTALLEAVFALPIFFLFAFGAIHFSILVREHSAIMRALNMAAETLQAASSMELISEEAMFHRAGTIPHSRNVHNMREPTSGRQGEYESYRHVYVQPIQEAP